MAVEFEALNSITASVTAAIEIRLLLEAVFLITNHSVVILQMGLIAMEINLDLVDNMNISISRTFKFQMEYDNNSNKFIDKWLEGNPILLREVRQITIILRQISFTIQHSIGDMKYYHFTIFNNMQQENE